MPAIEQIFSLAEAADKALDKETYNQIKAADYDMPADAEVSIQAGTMRKINGLIAALDKARKDAELTQPFDVWEVLTDEISDAMSDAMDMDVGIPQLAKAVTRFLRENQILSQRDIAAYLERAAQPPADNAHVAPGCEPFPENP